MVKIFKRRLKKDKKEEGLLKRLKNIEGKNEDQLNMIKNEKNQSVIKSILSTFDEDLPQDAKNVLNTLSSQEKSINYKKLYFKRDASLKFDFRDYTSLKEIFRDIYYNKFALKNYK